MRDSTLLGLRLTVGGDLAAAQDATPSSPPATKAPVPATRQPASQRAVHA
jgi:hypothetical protein